MTDLSSDAEVRSALRAIADNGTPMVVPDIDDLERFEAMSPPSGPALARGHRVLVAAIAVLVLLAGALVAVTRDREVEVAAATGRWQSMAASPLSPRFAMAHVWTGTELIVWGGRSTGPFPTLGWPLTFLRDGAAYDPRTDTWRRIADAPEVGFVDDSIAWQSWWTGTEAIFFTTSTQLGNDEERYRINAYSPVTDSWRSIPAAPLEITRAAALFDDQLVVVGETTIQGSRVFAASRTSVDAVDWSAPVSLGLPGHLLPTWAGLKRSIDAYVIGQDIVLHSCDPNLPSRLTTVRIRPDLSATGKTSVLGGPDTTTACSSRSAASDRLIATIGIVYETAVAGRNGERTTTKPASFSAVTPLAAEPAARMARTPPALPIEPVGDARQPSRLTWVGNGFVLIGGIDQRWRGGAAGPTAFAVDPDVRRWVRLPEVPIDLYREGHLAVYTGRELIVWGGAIRTGEAVNVANGPVADGARYVVP